MNRFTSGAAVAMLLLVGTSCGANELARFSWDEAPPRSGEVVGDAVKIEAPAAGGTYLVIAIAPEPITTPGYAFEGQVRYEGVEGDGYLEMWSDFPDGKRYFTRTLASSGPEGVISGDSGWRSFRLPFTTNGGPAPRRLDLDVVLPGSGTVYIGPLRLVPLGGVAWWSDRTAGVIGGGAGALAGILGALIGVLASRRKARGPVLTAMKVLTACGGALIAIGVVAAIRDQPYAVVFPLLLLGTVLAAVFGGGYRATRRGYEEAELRKMHAMDGAGV
jgi:hypothetical protein